VNWKILSTRQLLSKIYDKSGRKKLTNLKNVLKPSQNSMKLRYRIFDTSMHNNWTRSMSNWTRSKRSVKVSLFYQRVVGHELETMTVS
jgi:hypothetical protein